MEAAGRLMASEMDRRDFLKKTGRLAGAVVAAGSLGWLVGCSSGTVTREEQAPALNYGADEQGSQQNQQQTSPDSTSTGALNCHFYSNGICQKTGRACTNCISR